VLDGIGGGPGLGWAGLGWVLGPVRDELRSGPRSRTIHGSVRSTDLHGMGLYGSISGEGRTGPSLDRIKVRHGTDTDSATIWSTVTDRSERIGPAGPFQYSSCINIFIDPDTNFDCIVQSRRPPQLSS
jgi:hypothetical protein